MQHARDIPLESSDVSDVCPVFLIGAQKAGTSFLFELLVQNSGFAQSQEKEPKFFSKPRCDKLDFWDLFYIEPHHRFLIDASASYLHVAGTAEQIADRLGVNIPIIAVLRDPVERAISGYMHEVKHGRELRKPGDVFNLHSTSPEGLIVEERERLNEACSQGLVQPHYEKSDRYRDEFFQFRYIANSFYGLQLRPWQRFDRLFLVNFNELVKNPESVTKRVNTIMGIKKPTVIDTRVARNTTRIGLLKAFRENRHLHFEGRRRSALFVVYRLRQIIKSAPSVKQQFPSHVALLLQKEWDSIKSDEKLWI